MPLYAEFAQKYAESGFVKGKDDNWMNNSFACAHRVKFDLFNRYGAIAAAGDRHLAEFVSNLWYLKDPKTVKDWQFNLTTVDFREEQQAQRVAETIEFANGTKPFPLESSSEEAVDLMKALLGMKTIVSNVNLPNRGQMPQLPLGAIVETNCIFSNDQVKPVVSNTLPTGAAALVLRGCMNIETDYEGIKERNLDKIFAAFVNEPLCAGLDVAQARSLFREMCMNTREYLDPYYDLDGYFNCN